MFLNPCWCVPFAASLNVKRCRPTHANFSTNALTARRCYALSLATAVSFVLTARYNVLRCRMTIASVVVLNNSLGHIRRCSPSWEGRPPCRPMNQLAPLQGEKWDGVEAVPPSIERVLPKRSLCLVRPIPNAALLAPIYPGRRYSSIIWLRLRRVRIDAG